MDSGAWQATVHGVARVGHNLATKPPPPLNVYERITIIEGTGSQKVCWNGNKSTSEGINLLIRNIMRIRIKLELKRKC